MSLESLPEWKGLEQHAQLLRKLSIRDFFSEDAERGNAFSLSCCGLFLDYSKNLARQDTFDKLFALAKARGVGSMRAKMFAGEKINTTERRAVLHTALRNRSDEAVLLDGEDVMPKVRAVLTQMREFSEAVRSGEYKGYTGKAITDIVNIGIGGSDLGPQMVCKALHHKQHERLKVHFMSNVDSVHFFQIIKKLNPETTLFVVTSKTFATQETMLNAESAKEWFLKNGGSQADIAHHFVAVTSESDVAKQFGISTTFAIWDWVGGRYSLWSAVGLVIMLSVGYDDFIALLEGAYAMDQHFIEAPFENNMPVILAMLSIWYNNFLGSESHAILPYDEQLRLLPAYLEQVGMESNGKSVDKDGNKIRQSTSSIIWGAQGINGQHAFYQLLHQGKRMIPTDFIVSINSDQPLGKHHDVLVANFIAQTEALMRGRTLEETEASLQQAHFDDATIKQSIQHRVFEGNNPSNAIMIESLTPYNLGALIALYEHKVFVEGVVWGVNSYDQWGVELGKNMASEVLAELADDTQVTHHDCSTNNLINRYKKLRKR